MSKTKQSRTQPECNTDNLEDIDLRLNRAMQMHSHMIQELKLTQTQCEYLLNLEESLKNEHAVLKKSFLFEKVNSFQTCHTKIKNLMDKVATNQLPLTEVNVDKNCKATSKTANCSQSKHLFDIFSQSQAEVEARQIEQLQLKLGEIYSQIERCLREEQLSEKVMGRIKKESRRAGKMKTFQYLQKEINKYKGWLQDSKTKLNNDLIEKELQQKVVQNLESMKLLMNKKIINNDYIYETFGDTAEELLKLVQKMDQFGSVIQQKCQQYDKFLQQTYTNTLLKLRKGTTEEKGQAQIASLSSPPLLRQYFEHAHHVIQEAQSYANHSDLLQRCEKLKQAIDLTIKSFGK